MKKSKATQQLEEALARIAELEKKLKIPEAAPVEFPPVVYIMGKGIDQQCPICHRRVMVGICPKAEAANPKPDAMELPCGDRVGVVFK